MQNATKEPAEGGTVGEEEQNGNCGFTCADSVEAVRREDSTRREDFPNGNSSNEGSSHPAATQAQHTMQARHVYGGLRWLLISASIPHKTH